MIFDVEARDAEPETDDEEMDLVARGDANQSHKIPRPVGEWFTPAGRLPGHSYDVAAYIEDRLKGY